MKIAVVGTGYVGLVTGTCFAETGNEVICVDIDAAKVEKMRQGIVPIYEPDLDVLFERNRRQGRLRFTTELAEAVAHADIIFLALPTPPGDDGAADLRYILGVAADLSRLITRYTVVVDKSTVPVGTAELVHAALAEHLDESLFSVVSNPEFLREGVAVDDFMKPDRVVIGVEDPKAEAVMQRLYEPFVRSGNPIIAMDLRSAEMTKYAANSYLATRISFMNEIANLCEKVGADVDAVRKGMGSDTRIGKRFLFPGVGYGGSCFPKDVQALAHTAGQFGYNFRILEAVMGVNTDQRFRVADKIEAYYGSDLAGKTVALWGLAFKPNTDDIREAPALYTIDRLLAAGAHVRTFDPEAMENVRAIYGDAISYHEDQYEALEGADCLAIVTEWSVFRTPTFERMKEHLKSPVVFDGRNLYDLRRMVEAGFYYDSIGRQTVS
ncbi:UDP-glucose/GDP-mannose dehydrogenase family protein [Neolewinella lacunae]|uniref:UDP-glucose 6-dehydrogenase n=1 Tax=Neolewinella lacunae TaxID=1517758 RepID=A0A923PPQ0_9BACT|nr:UDP-glucose/GDP-mannose dehydrogenase family protein [Neolewinella lacunae]MBC6996290.1 UDP-glucose/GDP-mannose dehydrogenase family protein [Neolewinella lacunae]MDN3636913.1 UDP-glucose/GDP-mannose dehydrogenase family protein [Neolewinella lacunae]